MEAQQSPARQAQYVLRFYEEGMRRKIKASAALNERSMNAELLYLIKRGQEIVAKEKQGPAA